MHDLKLIEIGTISAVQMNDVALGNPACQICLESFRDNAAIVMGLAAAPAFSAHRFQQITDATAKAGREVYGPNYDMYQHTRTSETDLRHHTITRSYLEKFSHDDKINLDSRLEMAMKILAELVQHSDEYIQRSFESLLKAIIIQSWTAIEVSREDLLTNVMNDHKALFTNHNPRKISFHRPETVVAAYEEAFQNNPRIITLIKNSSFEALAGIRNKLVHNGGKIDEKFRTLTENNIHLKQFTNYNLGGLIRFDGEIVRDSVNPAFTNHYQLVQEVDRWICNEIKKAQIH